MAQKKSEFLSALGIMFQIWKVLVDEVLSLGGGDEELRRIQTDGNLRRKLAKLIVSAGNAIRNTFHIIVDYSQSLADMIKVGKYDGVNSDITAEHFPINQKEKVELDAELVHYGRNMESDAVIADLDSKGMRPATLPELLAFGAKYPDKQREFPIIALGSVWLYRDDYRYVAYLDRIGSGRRLRLAWYDDVWGVHCRFLAVRK